MEHKREKFVSLAESRVSKAMHAIRLVGNLANRSNYEFSDEDVRKILAALQAEITDRNNGSIRKTQDLGQCSNSEAPRND